MHRHVLRALLFVVGAALCVFFFVHFRWYAIVIAWFWSAEEMTVLVGETFLVRRITRPMWNFISKVCIIVLVGGYAVEGRYRNKVMQPVWNLNAFLWRTWQGLSELRRVAVMLVVGIALASIAWVHWQVVFIIPLAASLLRRVDYWLGNRLLDHWFGWLHLRFRENRLIHHSKLIRRLLRRPRHVYAMALLELEIRRERREERKKREKDKPN